MVLAIAFAVGSAFTTRHASTTGVSNNKFVDLWYANTAHNSGNPLTTGQVNAGVSYTDAQVTPAFLTQHCPAADILCLAKFAAGPSGSQIAYKPGRYQ